MKTDETSWTKSISTRQYLRQFNYKSIIFTSCVDVTFTYQGERKNMDVIMQKSIEAYQNQQQEYT